jgi:hypothetical protein
MIGLQRHALRRVSGRTTPEIASLRADFLAARVNRSQLFQLDRQAMTQRAFIPQLIQQLFRPIESV